MYAYKKACTYILLNFQSTIIYLIHKYTYTRIYIHTLTCRQTQAFNLPFVTRICTRMHTHIHTTHPHIDKAFGEGRSLWEGMVLCIRPSLAKGIHRGTLAYIRWGIRLECARAERPGEGDKVVGITARNFGRSLAIPETSVTFPAHASIEMYGGNFCEYHKSGKVAI